MTFPLSTMTLRVLSTLLCTTSLVACGGGGGGSANADSVQAGLIVAKGANANVVPAASPFAPATPVTPTGTSPITAPETPVFAETDAKAGFGGVVVTPVTPSAPVVPPVTVPVAPPAAPASGTLAIVTNVRLQDTSAAAQTSVPVTFGQVFAAGHVKPTDAMVGRLEDNTLVTLQMDVKARHADGSVRHAIFSAIIPTLAANATRTMSLAKNATPNAATATLPAELLAAGFTASTSATIAGVKYTASADQLLKTGAKATWLAGAVANEWHVSAPLTTSSGIAHPHLTARFAVRYYSAVKKARVDVTIENNWAYEPNPSNFTYNAEVIVGGKSAYTKTDLDHLVQARWRKVFWWGGAAPAVNTMLNTQYLIASRAVPNYDQTITIAPAVLTSLGSRMTAPATEPMGLGLAMAYMPTTGAHEDIGLLPSWATSYILTMDKRARDATLGTGDAAGSFSAHYRDKITDRPVSLKNYTRMTILGRSTDTYNQEKNRYESFPDCAGVCTTPYTHDTAHQPSLAYLPYLVTGDYYYLEELQFWAMYDTFVSNPNYRAFDKGLLIWDQLRGQAWSLRTLAQAAYITPDADVLKSDLLSFVNDNLDWYNATYSYNSNANKLGVPINGYSIAYNNDTSIATWMDDFFTSAVGYTADLGFDKASALLAWKAKFPVARMTAPGACWIMGAPYSLTIRTTSSTPVFNSVVEGYTKDLGADFMKLTCNSPEMAAKLGLKIGDMGNISDGTMGYPANMQPALAYSVDSGIAASKTAWTLFQGRTVKPNYSNGAHFAIVPR
jgi:hypothetical protein